MKIPHSSFRTKTAFTLIEVTIAIAILAVVILSYIGLLGAGINNMTDAINRSTEGRITQSMLREVQQADWDTLDTDYASEGARTRYFDDQGSPVAKGNINHIYTARLYLDTGHGGNHSNVELPGDVSAKVNRTPHLRNVIVRITNRPGAAGEALLDDNESTKNYREYPGTVFQLKKAIESVTP